MATNDIDFCASPPLASTVSVIPLPILEDNYSYLVMDTKNKLAVVVDPADPQAIIVSFSEINYVYLERGRRKMT